MPTERNTIHLPRAPRSLSVLVIMSEAGKLNYELHGMLSELRALYEQIGVPYRELFCPGFDQPQARAEIFAEWWHRDETEDALAIDTDMRADPRLAIELALLEEPLLLAPYRLKRSEDLDPTGWALDLGPDQDHSEVREGRRMLPVNGAGFGFVRVRRQAFAKMIAALPLSAPTWTSHAPGTLGMKVWGLFEPIVHEHPAGSGVLRRRPEDMSFFARARAAGVQPFALLDAVVWNGDKGGESFSQCLDRFAIKSVAIDKRVRAELRECPENLKLGLVEVLDGAYDVPGLAFDRPPVVLDVGANVGAFSVWASKRWPGAKIHAYEPHPEMAAHLRANVEGIEPRVVVREVAVTSNRTASKSAHVRLYDGKHNDGERSIHPTEGVHQLDAFVEVATWGAHKLPPCDVLKIDTEGAEREILEGYGALLEGCTAVMLEWHSTDDYLWFHDHLRAHGFLVKSDRAKGRPMPDREIVFIKRGAKILTPEEQGLAALEASELETEPPPPLTFEWTPGLCDAENIDERLVPAHIVRHWAPPVEHPTAELLENGAGE